MEKRDAEKDILEAAKKVFITKGSAGARIQEIADMANINKAMLYYYFKTKEQLFNRIIEDAAMLMSQNIIPALIGDKNIIDKLEQLTENYIDTLSEHPYIPIFILSELNQHPQTFQDKVQSRITDSNVLPNLFQQILLEQQQNKIKPIAPQHLILTVMALLVFPFVAKPIFTQLFKMGETQYVRFMNERKAEVKKIIRLLLKPNP